MYMIFVFLCLKVFSFSDNGIYIENRIMIGNELVFNSPQYGREYIWIIKDKPFFSKAFIDSKQSMAYFIPDKAGNYNFELYVDGNYYGEKNFFVIKNTKSSEKEIFENFNEYYKKNNLYMMLYNMQLIEENYSASYYIKEMYDKIIDLAYKIDNTGIQEEYLNKILLRYKLTDKEDIGYLVKLYKIYEKNKNENKMEKVYTLILNKDKSYIVEYAEKYILKNHDKYFSILLDYYKSTFDKKAGEIIGNYYFSKKDYCNAEIYYKNSNKKKLIEIYIENKNQEKIDKMMSNLEDSEKIAFQKFIIESRAKERDKNYYITAEENFKNYKFEIAELYYNRILKESIDNELKTKVMYKLAKLYFSEKKYNLSKKYFEDFIQNNVNEGLKIDSLYHIGVILFDTNQASKSEAYFDDIIENYPFTLWETKSRIYKIKIKNIKEQS